MVINFKKEEIEKRYNIEMIEELNGVSNLNNPKNNSLIFCLDYKTNFFEKLSTIKNSLIIVNEDAAIPKIISENNNIIYIDNPRREYVWILNNYVIKAISKYEKSSYYISPKAQIGSKVLIEPFVFVDEDVVIGNNCVLKSGAKIYKNTIIGDNTIIGPNSIIGEIGFGTERLNNGKRKVISFEGIPMKMPHYGGVKIGENVEIGALSTVVAGAIEATVIENNVKTDDHIHIAHNCIIREGTLIAACAEISGGVEVGKNTWIGPNVSIMQKIKIGHSVIIGLGAVVLKNVEDTGVIVGNPGKNILKIERGNKE